MSQYPFQCSFEMKSVIFKSHISAILLLAHLGCLTWVSVISPEIVTGLLSKYPGKGLVS